jgi:ankyrin repeat protein
VAALFGRVDMAELLLDRGADINAGNEWNWTPLHYAATHRREMVGFLLKRGGARR